jgi:hypothetical protein
VTRDERLELVELVNALRRIAPRNARAARLLLQLGGVEPEETRIDFRLTIVDPGGKTDETP